VKKKKWLAAVTGVVLTLCVFVGVLAIAAEYGGQDDPLVSLSYINSVFAPELQKQIDGSINGKINSFLKQTEDKLSAYSNEVDKTVAEFVSENTSFVAQPDALDSIATAVAGRVQGQSGATASFVLVKLTEGQTLICSIGTEVLLRLGSASCVSTGTPGLIDTTDAKNLANGLALSKNHLYLCTVEGRGVYAASNATVLVRGKYSIQ